MSQPSITNCPFTSCPASYGGIYVQPLMKLLLFPHHVCLIQVTTAPGFHLFPFRTEKLSPVTPMVLRNSGRVGSRRFRGSPRVRNDEGAFAFSTSHITHPCHCAFLLGAVRKPCGLLNNQYLTAKRSYNLSFFFSLPQVSFGAWVLEKKKEKKLPKKFGSYALKFLPLHPLLKTKAARVDILFLETVHGSSSFFYFFLPPFRQERRRGKRKGKKKNFRKNLEVML